MQRLFHGMLLIGIFGSLVSCSIGTPFKRSEVAAAKNPDDLVVVALTHVVLGDDDELNDLFWDYVFRIEDELPQFEGLVGHSLRKRLFSDEGWTMSVWESEEAMEGFVRSGLHKEAVRRTKRALESVRFARVKIPRKEVPPSWEQAERLLDEQNQ